MAVCKFCKDLEWLKTRSAELKKSDGINTYYKAGLFYHRFKDRIIRSAGNFDTYTLNFCPVCGTKLIKPIRQKKKL